MGNPAQIITDYIRTYDGVDTTSDTDGDYAPRRAQLLVFLNHINSYIHYFREWEWTWGETEFTIAAGTKAVSIAADLPTYLEFGREGGLFDTARRKMLKEKSRYLVIRERMLSGVGSSGAADSFTISGGQIQLPYVVSSDTPFLAYHRVLAEVLVDDDTEMLLPDRYVATVLLPGLCFRAQESKNDARETWGSQFKEGLSQMCSLENPNKTGTRKSPLAVRGAW